MLQFQLMEKMKQREFSKNTIKVNMTRTKYKNKYRKDHPKLRNKCRKNNYSKSRPEIRKNKSWGPIELSLIRNKDFCDTSLSRIMQRSVQAIQQKRYKLNLDAKRISFKLLTMSCEKGNHESKSIQQISVY